MNVRPYHVIVLVMSFLVILCIWVLRYAGREPFSDVMAVVMDEKMPVIPTVNRYYVSSRDNVQEEEGRKRGVEFFSTDLLTYAVMTDYPSRKAMFVDASNKTLIFCISKGILKTETPCYIVGDSKYTLDKIVRNQDVKAQQTFSVMGTDYGQLAKESSWIAVFYGKINDPFLLWMNQNKLNNIQAYALEDMPGKRMDFTKMFYKYPYVTSKNVDLVDLMKNIVFPVRILKVHMIDDVIFSTSEEMPCDLCTSLLLHLDPIKSKSTQEYYEHTLDFHREALRYFGISVSKKGSLAGIEPFSNNRSPKVSINIEYPLETTLTRWRRDIFKEIHFSKKNLNTYLPIKLHVGDVIKLTNQFNPFVNDTYIVTTAHGDLYIAQMRIELKDSIVSRKASNTPNQELIVMKLPTKTSLDFSSDTEVYIAAEDKRGVIKSVDLDGGVATILMFDDEAHLEKGNYCMSNPLLVKKEDCLAFYDPTGKIKTQKDYWDQPCQADTDCPFYDGELRGGCDKGICEMPVGIKRNAYRQFDSDSLKTSVCLERDTVSRRCSKYAFWGDNLSRHIKLNS